MHRFTLPVLVLALSAPAAGAVATHSQAADLEPRLERKDPSADPSHYEDVVDSQGNRYKIDPAGNVFTNGTPNPSRQPASAENVIYYYNYAVDMMSRGYTAPALEVYREILALPVKDELVAAAQEVVRKAYDEVYSFRDNAEKLSDLLFVIRHVEDGRIFYENEKYHFRIQYPVNWKMDGEVRHDPEQNFAGMNLYPLPLPAPDGETVTVAIGLRVEYLQESKTTDEFGKYWVSQLEETDLRNDAFEVLKRERLSGESKFLRERFEFKVEDGRRVGQDAFLVKGDYGYYLTFTATPATYSAAQDIFERFTSEFEVLD
ncbi:MAG: hypothetical protein V3U86_13360 [Acidobacteriota bacterium]